MDHIPVAPTTPLPYLRGLDGLRALAVLAVLLFHAGLPVPGGFLGVETFFAISGFLITALLQREWQQAGTIDLKRFWVRRARRLLPALLALLVGVLALAAVLLPAELGALGRETLAALGYITNWYLIGQQQSYFDPLSRPSLLQHLWSLAVEEQFYLLWPLLVLFGARRLPPRALIALVGLGAAASALLLMAQYQPGDDVSRLYYGTDTRISAMLIGAVGALLWMPRRDHARRGWATDAGGVLAVVLLVLAYIWFNEQRPLLYRGGFQAVALLSTAALIATTHPQARVLPWLLETAPLRWIGLRSYSLYLWHWPVFLLLRPGIDVPLTGLPAELVRFAIALALAAASYRLVEQPVRRYGFRGAFGRAVQSIRHPQRPAASPLALGALAATGVIALVTLPSTFASPPAPRQEARPTAAPVAPTATPLPIRRNAASAIRVPTPQPTQPPPTAIPPTPLPAGPALPAALTAELQQLLDATVADGYIPGAVLSVEVPGYARWTSSAGLASAPDAIPIELDTPVRLASVSKMFTAVVALQLVEEGVLELDAPVARWLPDLLPDGDRITVRNLLQHTSGLYDYLEDRNLVAQAQRDPSYEWQPAELVAYATEFDGGAIGRWDYSSTNYVVLGMLIEQATGKSLAQHIRERIFTPLDMPSSVFAPQEAVPARLARGYTQYTDITDVSMSFGYGTSSVVASIDDLQTFGRALFAGYLLSPASMDAMRQTVSGRGQYGMPDLAYGLGLMRTRLPLDAAAQATSPNADLVYGHIGGYGGFRAALWYAPDSGTSVVLVFNQAMADPNDLATGVFDRVLVAPGN